MENNLKTCLICLTEFTQNELVELQPCSHFMCSACFLIFPTKLKTDKCPTCTQQIVTYGSNQNEFADLLNTIDYGKDVDCELIGETLDHQFFLEELNKILSLNTLLIN